MRRTRWLDRRLAQICRAVGDGDRGSASPARPDDWQRILETIGALAEDPEKLEQHLAPVTSTTGRLFGQWTTSGLEGLTSGATPAFGKKERHLIRGHLTLLRQTRTAAPILFLVDCLLEGDPAIAGNAALLIGHHAETYAEAALPLAVALRTGSPQTAPAVAWAFLRVLMVHSELIPILDSDPAPAVRRVVLRAAVATLAAAQGPASLLSQIECSTEDPDREVRALAFGALHHLTSARRLELAEAGLADPIPRVARATARTLAASGDPAAIGFLIRTLGTAGSELQRTVLDALPPSVGTAESQLPAMDGSTQAWALAVRATIGDLDAAEVLGFLQHPQTEIRRAAARSLSRVAARSTSHDWLPQLLASWQQENEPQVLLALAECLATMNRDVASEVILTRLAKVPDSVREQLLEVLARAELFHQIEMMQSLPEPPPAAGETAGR